MTVVTATAVLGALSYKFAAAGPVPAPAAKGFDSGELARVGIQLTMPTSAAKLTGAQVHDAAVKALPLLMKEATAVSIQRVMYGTGTNKQPAWLVSLDGLSIAGRGPRGMTNMPVNSQLHLVLDDNGQPIFSYTYQ